MPSSPGSRLAMPSLATPGPSRHAVRQFAGRCQRSLRRHWLFAILAGCATALRVVVQFAYQPALIFPDSERYLRYAQQFIDGHWAPDWLRTSGYSLLLIPAVLTRNLAVVAAVQHVLGIAAGVLIYALLLHFGARRWLAALAAIPVLFDPLQLDIEQYVLTDISATFLLTAALAVLVWKHDRMGRAAPVAAGLLIAAATVIREPDLLVIIPAVLYLAAVIRPWRRLAVHASLLLAAFLLPVLGYLSWFDMARGQFGFVSYTSEFMYGRIAQFAECKGVPMPSYERWLCPDQPPAQRNPDFYMWKPQSPQVTFRAPPGMDKNLIIADFDRRIIEHQPLTYLKVVAGDILYSFSPVRGDGPEHYPTWYHDFHPYFPIYQWAVPTLHHYTGRGPYADPPLARFLTGYGRDFYVPGPLLAAGLLAGVAGMAGIGRARRSRLRAPCLLFTLGAASVIFPPFVIATFDWRYELPQFSLIPAAAVLGGMALLGAGRGRPAAAEPTTAGVPAQRAMPAWPAPDGTVPAARHPTGDAGDRAGGYGPPGGQPGPPVKTETDA